MIHGDNTLCKLDLQTIRMLSSLESSLDHIDLFETGISREFEILDYQIISDIDEFLIHTLWSLVNSDRIGTRLRHLLPIGSDEKLEGHDVLLRESMGIHECASCEEIEVLIIPTELDITRTIALRDRDRIISLHDRIEEFLE